MTPSFTLIATPNPLDVSEVIQNPAMCYQIDLLLADPAPDAWSGFGDLEEPSDPSYSSQQVFGTLETISDTVSALNCQPVLFSGEKFVTSQTVTGHTISLKFSDQTIPVTVETYDNPIVLSPTSSDLNINASFLVYDYPDALNIIWS